MATAGEGAGAKARGLLKRADNLYSDLPRHHETLRGELDRDRAELDDLLANPPGPFEHTGELMHPPGNRMPSSVDVGGIRTSVTSILG